MTTQLFIGQPKPSANTDDTQALGPEQAKALRYPEQQESSDGESTRVLSLEELEQIAADTHDDRIDGPREEAQRNAPKATRADAERAQQQAEPSRWPGAAAAGAAHGHTPPPPPAAPTVGAAYQDSAQPRPQRPYPSEPSATAGYPQAAGIGGATAAAANSAGAGMPAPHALPGPGDPGRRTQSATPGARAEKKAKMPASAIALLVVVALVVLGIIGYILVDVLSGQNTGDSQSMPAPPPVAEGSEDPDAEASAPSSTAAAEIRSFASPSGNIACTIQPERARCVISSFTYDTPDEPADCAIDNWGGVVVANEDGAGFSCMQAPEAPEAQTLDYGESIEAHGMKCTSERDGMSCVSTVTGTGFTIARAGVDFTN